MNRIGRVAGTNPLMVRFFGDTLAVRIDLLLDGYTPTVNDAVWMVELVEGQWLCAGAVVSG